ncbi:MAG TPA: putative Ig domain-containing protein [Thermoanaerobaculia bacterium]|nr:putative Ig domain-containing protein [Thermoanaerobaculia bacterium]
MKGIAGLLVAAVGAVLLAAPAQATVSYTIASESGSVMYTDIGNGENATYLVFQVTSDTTVPDVWLKLDTSGSSIISNVGTGVHQLRFNMSTGTHGTVPTAGLGLTANVPKAVFFLVKASSTTNTNQPLVVRVYDGDPSGSGSEQTNHTFNFTVADTIKASPNKVNTVITIPNNPTIGELGTITVTGCTGTVGAGKVLYFTPVADDTWPADAFEFIDSDIQIDNYSGSPYRGVALIPNGDVLTTNNCYDEIFTFVIDGVGTATTSPTNYIDSGGTNIKHTVNTSGSFSVTIPPPECPTITVSVLGGGLPNAFVGSEIAAVFQASPTPASGGVYHFAASGLPAWLTLDPNTGLLDGTPAIGDLGSVSFTVTATISGGDNDGCSGQAQFSFDVICPAATISTTPNPLPDAVAGQPYLAFVTTSFFATFSSPNLPSWLQLTPSAPGSAELSGTPSESDAGPVSITINAISTDTNAGCTLQLKTGFNVVGTSVVVPTLDRAGIALLALALAGAALILIRRA